MIQTSEKLSRGDIRVRRQQLSRLHSQPRTEELSAIPNMPQPYMDGFCGSEQSHSTLNLDKNSCFFATVFPLPLINYEFVFISFLELNILPIIGGHSLDLRSDRLCNGRDSQLSSIVKFYLWRILNVKLMFSFLFYILVKKLYLIFKIVCNSVAMPFFSNMIGEG